MNVVIALVALAAALTGCSKSEKSDPKPTESAVSIDHAEEITFEAAGMTLYGTITRPAGDGKFPAIAIAAGSGPTDRDWLNPLIPGPNGSGRLLAQALADAGVVLLRYDKRATGKSGMPPGSIAWGDYAAELGAATALLATRDYVDTSKVFVAGHSEGGVHALRVAATPPVPIAGVILISVAGRSLRDIVLWQISNQIRASLAPEAAEVEIAALTQALNDIAASKAVDGATVGSLPGVQQFVMALQNPQSVEFARGLLVYDPLAAFAEFDAPVLVINGARDIQVDPDLDAQPLAAAARAAGRETQIVIVDEADHVLKVETTPREQLTPAVGALYNAAGRILAPEIPAAIVEFVKR